MILSIYALLIGLLYTAIQLYLRHHWNQVDNYEAAQDYRPKTSVAIIIPARNEEDNIASCLKSIANQNYPAELFEIIVVDDHSEDDTIKEIKALEEPAVSVIQLGQLNLPQTKAHKKRALELGIQQSTAQLIVTTDADVIVGQNWLREIVSFFESSQASLITGPVLFDPAESSFEVFQALDFIGMIGITGAGIKSGLFHMSNGANMAFSREAFNQIEGYRDMDHIASGDDILLAQKMLEHPNLKVSFLKSKDAIVKTKPCSNWFSFFHQRLRWGAKSEHYSEKSITWVQFVVLITCLSLMAFLILIFFNWQKYLLPLLILFVLKSGSDYISLKSYAQFFDRKRLLKAFATSTIYHVLYISIIGLASVFIRRYQWKGRVVS